MKNIGRRTFFRHSAIASGGVLASGTSAAASVLWMPSDKTFQGEDVQAMIRRSLQGIPQQTNVRQNYANDADWANAMQAGASSNISEACMWVGFGARVFGITNVWMQAGTALCMSIRVVNAAETHLTDFGGWVGSQYDRYIWYVMSHAYPPQP
jgi:hypothetical protein